MIIVVMGPTGSGKTTIGTLLAKQLEFEFVDADDFHSPENKQKIHKGIALTDADRAPWLGAIHEQITRWIEDHWGVVLACSALKQSYREQLWDTSSDVQLVYLKGSYELIFQRLVARKGHFANEQILASQFATLEEPSEAITVDIGGTPEEIVSEIRARLGARPAGA